MQTQSGKKRGGGARCRCRLVLYLLCVVCSSSVASADKPANSDPKVKYVGSEKCIRCHQDEHKSYLATTHSVAAEFTNIKKEPAPGTFWHPLSENSYEALYRDGKLVHRELRSDANGEKKIVAEAEIAFSIGSGAHGKSYLFRDGDFWAQSPISWFKETGSWGMSPGYDRPLHLSFKRETRSGCAFCHVGSVERKDGNPYIFEIVESTIGCERCHGPGELHVEKYRHVPEGVVSDADVDHLIVNPDNLSRELSEAICHQCHLQGVAKSLSSGKDEWDYRPGLELTDFRVDYQYRLGDGEMRIVGHVEQMHMSECYKQTETLTCVTCHDPHNTPRPEDAIDHYRSVCLNCHEEQSCGKPHQQRMQLAGNNCAECHMPAMDTNVAHAAFRQHRVGIYEDVDTSSDVAEGIIPVVKPVNLSAQQKLRGDALAKVHVYRSDPGNPAFIEFGLEATAELVKLKQLGVNDEALNVGLAQVAELQKRSDVAAMLARDVRKQQPLPTQSRIDATRMLAEYYFQRNDFKKAVALYREAVAQRRSARDNYFLALCENNVGNVDAAIAALKRSIEIEPLQDAAHVGLQAIYHARGNAKQSQDHGREAARIRERLSRLGQRARELAKEPKD